MNRHILLALSSTALLTGCLVKDPSQVTADSYNSLVQKYNALVENSTQKDEIMLTTSEQLNEVGDSYGKIRTLREKIEGRIAARDCEAAKNLIDKDLRAQSSTIQNQINKLTQGSITKAMAAIKAGTKTIYSESSQGLMNLRASIQELDTSPLSGMKEDVTFTFNDLVANYNKNCVTTAPFGASPALAETSAAPTAPKADPTKIITSTGSGSIGSVTRELMKTKYRGFYSESAFNQFAGIADSTGGNFAYSPSAAELPSVVDAIFKAIEARASTETDLAIVLDVTSSMGDDIDSVKSNLISLTNKLQTLQKRNGLRVALLLYSDQGDEFITKVALPFTDSLESLSSQVKAVSLLSGGDEPEAVADALDAARTELKWRRSSSKSLMLIGDAPGHETSWAGRKMDSVVHDLKLTGAEIIVYPILVNK